jgi:spore coat polysaccharide biosynthesis predicted glycosyltransferase SpsG
VSDTRRAPFVLFVAAAGPRCGFGHLVRAGVLADALGASRHLVLRGPDSALDVALAFGWTVHRGPRLLAHLAPDLVVVDDPAAREGARWVRLARAAQIPVVVIRDGGAAVAGADLTVDGSLVARPSSRADRLGGPSYALLRPRPSARRARPVSRDCGRVLVALGGGAHVGHLGVSIASAIASHCPGLRVDIARGFALTGTAPRLPARCRWVSAPDGLGDRLAAATAAVVAGGVTLYEACALGTPIVAVPVVPAQRRAIAAAAAAGAALAVTARGGPQIANEVAALVARLIDRPDLAASLSRRARRLVDGHGVTRVASRIRSLLMPEQEGWRHAA